MTIDVGRRMANSLARHASALRPHTDADRFAGIPIARMIQFGSGKIGYGLCRGYISRVLFRQVGRRLIICRGAVLQFRNLIRVGNNCFIGRNCYINAYSTGGIAVGDNFTLREFGWVQLSGRFGSPGESLEIGDDVYIGPFANLGVAAPVQIGSGTQVGAFLSIAAEAHSDRGSGFTDGSTSRTGICIGRNVWIGNRVTILDGVDVGDGAVIGAGSVVTKPVRAGTTVAGVPARELNA